MTLDRSSQSWPAALVDGAIVVLVGVLALRGVHDQAAWALVSMIVGARFGVAYGKMAERTSDRSGPGQPYRGGGGDAGGTDGPAVPPTSTRPDAKARRLSLDVATVFAAILIALALAVGPITGALAKVR